MPKEQNTQQSPGLGRSTVPQIYIDATHVGGCDDLMALDKAGGLDALLHPEAA